MLFLRQNRYLPLNSDYLLGKQPTMLRYGSQPSNSSYLRFGDFLNFLQFVFACQLYAHAYYIQRNVNTAMCLYNDKVNEKHFFSENNVQCYKHIVCK